MPGTGSIDLSKAEALQNYVLTYSDDLILQGFTTFDAAFHAHGIEGVKGTQILPQINIGKLTGRYSKPFTPKQDAIKIGAQSISVETAKLDLEIDPLDFERNQITGQKRQKGQGQDIPFEQEIMNGVKEQLTPEVSDAFWNGVKTATPLNTDDLNQLFDGQRKLHQTYGATGKIEALPIPGGTYTQGNIIKHFGDMFQRLGKPYRNGAYFHTSPQNYKLYFEALRATAPAFKPEEIMMNGKKYLRDYYNDCWITAYHDLSGTEFVTLCGNKNMFYAFDAYSDAGSFRVIEVINGIQLRMVYKFGVQLVMPEPHAIVYNLK